MEEAYFSRLPSARHTREVAGYSQSSRGRDYDRYYAQQAGLLELQQEARRKPEAYVQFEDMMQGSITFNGSGFAQFRCVWTIYNMLKVTKNITTNQYVESKQKISTLDGKVSFRLRLKPHIVSHAGSNMNLFIHVSDDSSPCWISMKTAVIGKTGKEYYQKFLPPVAFGTGSLINTTYGIPCTSTEELVTDLPYGCLHLLVQGTAWEKEPLEKRYHEKLLKVNPTSSLSYLYQSGVCSDINISVEEEIFQVHKSILSAKSSVFQTIFQQKSENIIVLSNISSEVFREILVFIYTDTITPVTENYIVEVLKAAHEYELTALKEICQIKMCQKVNVKNAVDYLQVADELCAGSLKEKCFQFITKNRKEVFKEQSWKVFLSKSTDLLADLLNRFMIQ